MSDEDSFTLTIKNNWELVLLGYLLYWFIISSIPLIHLLVLISLSSNIYFKIVLVLIGDGGMLRSLKNSFSFGPGFVCTS